MEWKGMFEWIAFLLALFVLMLAFPLPAYAQPSGSDEGGMTTGWSDSASGGGQESPVVPEDPVPAATFWMAVAMIVIMTASAVWMLMRRLPA